MTEIYIDDKEKVICTAFFYEPGDKGKKPVFSTRSAIFTKFELISDMLQWAYRMRAPKDRVLKVEVTTNDR